MSTVKFVIELGFEELPARYCPVLLNLLKSNYQKACLTYALPSDTAVFYLTPRRFILTATYPKKQCDQAETILGPPIDIAMNQDGSLKPAGIGFLKKVSATIEDLQRCKDKKGREIFCIIKNHKGESIEPLLKRFFSVFFDSLPLPISMTWGDGLFSFLRPVRWVFCMLNNEVLPINIMGVNSGNVTYGHRFLSKKESADWLGLPMALDKAQDLLPTLKKTGKVIYDQAEREALIMSCLDSLKQESDDEWLNEVIYLLESPYFLKQRIESKYRALPDKVIETCLKKHQKYFPLRSDRGDLNGEFLIVADNVSSENETSITEGNLRVLRARLDDAYFYYESDLKKGLNFFSKQLATLRYQEGFGSMADKQDRILCLASYLNQEYFDCADEDIKKVVPYLKADLLTLMVQEFPNLQGYVGRVYLKNSDLSEDHGLCIEQHYWPLSAQAELPQSSLAALFSLSDKVDHLCAAFFTGQEPSGSRDPMGIRRAVAAVIKIVLQRGLKFSFRSVISYHLKHILSHGFSSKYNQETLSKKIQDFIFQRLKTELESHDFEADLLLSQLSLSYLNIDQAFKNAELLSVFKSSYASEYGLFLETAKRVDRLSQSVNDDFDLTLEVDSSLFQVEAETLAHKAYQDLFALSQQKTLLLREYLTFCHTLSRYFEDVMVMTDDSEIKNNRLFFLKKSSRLFSFWGDLKYLK